MIDRATLSASQEQWADSSLHGPRYTEVERNPTVVSSLSASLGSLRKNLPSLQEAIQNNFEIPSILTLTKVLEYRYSWQERKSASSIFVGSFPVIEQWYTFRNREETLQIIEKYPVLNLYLLEIHNRIMTYFPGAKLFLQTIAESETVDKLEAFDDESLVISVVSHIRPREALERLKQFYRNWWLIAPNRAKIKEKISFNLECI